MDQRSFLEEVRKLKRSHDSQSEWALLRRDGGTYMHHSFCMGNMCCNALCSLCSIRYKCIPRKSFSISVDLKKKASAYWWIHISRPR
ncbi:uncharacterized protein LOC127256240 isoform X2 [Andrographis paniculata]|uniref:uncharacterized protein LOC127256240 isoform X2 n=1 Tax=Andrographis paniculata TaxID=175694 RepID=UPI0021E7FEB8|nr:uncharacterized protein LOC127256240 isoform X2 [Andrographis paniculata]